ncbi:hypothetical protein [Mycoplasma sp. 5370]
MKNKTKKIILSSIVLGTIAASSIGATLAIVFNKNKNKENIFLKEKVKFSRTKEKVFIFLPNSFKETINNIELTLKENQTDSKTYVLKEFIYLNGKIEVLLPSILQDKSSLFIDKLFINKENISLKRYTDTEREIIFSEEKKEPEVPKTDPDTPKPENPKEKDVIDNPDNGSINNIEDPNDKQEPEIPDSNENDDFVISSLEILEKTDEFAKLKVNFSKHLLKNVKNKDFQIEISGKIKDKQFFNSQQYIENSDSVIFNLSNLEFSENYLINNITLNNKPLTSLNSAQKIGNNWENSENTNDFVFQTNEYSQKISYESISYHIDETNPNRLLLSFNNVEKLFEFTESEYIGKLTLKDKTNSDTEFTVDISIRKTENEGLKNIPITISTTSDSSTFDYEDGFEIPSNAILEIVDFKIDRSGLISVVEPRISILPKDGINKEFSSKTSFSRFKNTEFNLESNNNLKVKTELELVDIDQSNLNDVKLEFISNFGGYWKINATKVNDKWEANIPNYNYYGKISLTKVFVNNKEIQLDYLHKGVLKFNNDKNREENALINSVNITENKENSFISDISVNFNNSELLDQFSLLKPRLEIFDINNQTQIIEPKFLYKDKNNYIFSTYLKNNVNYKIKKLSFGTQDFNFENSFTKSKTSTPKTEIELNEIINNISSLNLTKKYWASGALKSLNSTSDFIKITDINKIRNFDDSIEIEVNKSSSETEIDERNGILKLNIKLKSGSNYSISKKITINNLYNVNFFEHFNQSNSYFEKLISISNKGLTKSTLDFDKTFTEVETNDLHYSFGNPTTWVEIKDEKLNDFLNIDESLKSYDSSKLKIFFIKFRDQKNLYDPHITSAYAMQGFMEYKIGFWFDNLNENNPESKYKKIYGPMLVGGFNFDNTSQSLYLNFKEKIEKFSTEKWDEFNSYYGFKNPESVDLDNLIAEINQISNKEERWNKILEYTKISKLLSSITDLVKNSFNSPISKDFYNIQVETASKETIGENNFLKLKVVLKSHSFNRTIQNNENNNIGNNFIDILFLKR